MTLRSFLKFFAYFCTVKCRDLDIALSHRRVSKMSIWIDIVKCIRYIVLMYCVTYFDCVRPYLKAAELIKYKAMITSFKTVLYARHYFTSCFTSFPHTHAKPRQSGLNVLNVHTYMNGEKNTRSYLKLIRTILGIGAVSRCNRSNLLDFHS